MTYRNQINIIFRQGTNRRVRVVERIEKRIRICGFRSECCNAQQMQGIEFREKLPSEVELLDWQNESIQHPRFGRTHITRVVPQRWFKCQTARREHSGVIN